MPETLQTKKQEIRVVQTPKWVRARVAGVTVADTRKAKILYQGKVARAYAFPVTDIHKVAGLSPGEPKDHPVFGRIRDASIRVGDRSIERAVRIYEEGPAVDKGLAGYATIAWDKVDSWYEEDEEVFVHPRDPFHRIDILHSSRHVVVEIDGESVAETRRPTILFETGLPPRYYLPHEDVRLEMLTPSDLETGCPYKGFASYHNVQTAKELHENLVWTYKTPFPEAHKILGLLAFYDEKVDVTVDGEPQERPQTVWSKE